MIKPKPKKVLKRKNPRYLDSPPKPRTSRELENIEEVLEYDDMTIIVILKQGSMYLSVYGKIKQNGRDYIVQEPVDNRDTSAAIFQQKDISRIYFNVSQNVIAINLK